MDGLEPGVRYRFKVQAEAFNGVGPESDVAMMYACTVPQNLSYPLRGETATDSMTLEWEPPSSDGGCPVTSYALFRDDGSS